MGILTINNVTCKLGVFFYYWAESCTQWLLVMFTINRVIALAWPLAAITILSANANIAVICANLYL